jgi:hypothetical protein
MFQLIESKCRTRRLTYKLQTPPKQGLWGEFDQSRLLADSPGNAYVDPLMIPVMTVIIAITMVLIILLPTTVIPVLVPALAMLFLVTRHILAVVPVVLHKVDSLATGVVFVTVLAPMFGVARRHAQIDRRTVHRYPLNDYRLAINDLWLRVAANVDSAIEAGLANTHRDGNVGSLSWEGHASCGYCGRDQKTFHVESPVLVIVDIFIPPSFDVIPDITLCQFREIGLKIN